MTNETQLSAAEIAAAQHEGQKDAVRDAASHGDPGLPGATPGKRLFTFAPSVPLEPVLLLGIDELKAALKEGDKTRAPVPQPHAYSESEVATLLELERSGKNRTEFVKLYMKHLGVESPFEVTSAGPNYTNDTTSTSNL